MDLNGFELAQRSQTNILVLHTGPSNSGKTFGALLLAYGITQYVEQVLQQEIITGVLDAERKRSSFYVGHPMLGGFVGRNQPAFPFRIKEISENFSAKNYMNAIKIAEKNGIGILIIDSITHAWAGKGGLLEQKDKVAEAQRNKNDYTAWQPVDKDYNALLEAFLQYPGHVIVTVRSREAHELKPIEDKGGKVKMAPERIGQKPVFREGKRGSLFYEFPVAFRFGQADHRAEIEKDITQVFDSPDVPWEPRKLTPEDGYRLAEWTYATPGAEHPEEQELNGTFEQPTEQDQRRAAKQPPRPEVPPEVVPGPALRNATRNARRLLRDEDGDERRAAARVQQRARASQDEQETFDDLYD